VRAWIALECVQGKNWARTTATVFCALGILGAFIGLDAGRSPATVIMGFVVAGIGLISVSMLWQRSPNAFFGNVKRLGS
jgi:VIT1/CCC1 family predicted Fe2+/Mn2+ transporter